MENKNNSLLVNYFLVYLTHCTWYFFILYLKVSSTIINLLWAGLFA